MRLLRFWDRQQEAKAQTARAATQSRIIAQKARAERIEKAMARGRE